MSSCYPYSWVQSYQSHLTESTYFLTFCSLCLHLPQLLAVLRLWRRVPVLLELKAQAIAHLETHHLKDALASDPLYEQDAEEAQLHTQKQK